MTRRVHCKKEPFDVYIGRGSPYGNKYVFKPTTFKDVVWVPDRDSACASHMRDLRLIPESRLIEFLKPLVGKVLGCYCHENERCHGDNYIQLIKECGLDRLD